MPQWAGSSWYYLRYIDPSNENALVDTKKEAYWSPVDFYVGGAEHATRHLIYARFWHKFLYDIGVVSHDEPFKRLQHVGLIMAEDGRKMSKRWGNVINPDKIVAEHGADAMRVYEMFMGPFSQSCAWSTNGLIGARKFLDRVWKAQDFVKHSPDIEPNSDSYRKFRSCLHETIKKVSEDISEFKFNTAIAQVMILVNELYAIKAILKDDYKQIILILAPFAPYLCEEIWQIQSMSDKDFNKKNLSVHEQKWPIFDLNAIVADDVVIVVQVNGKKRGEILISVDRVADKDYVIELAGGVEKVKKMLTGKSIKRSIYVPSKLVNFVA